MQALEELAKSGKASVRDFQEEMNDFSIARLNNEELVRLTDILLGFPGIIDTVTKYPATVKGNLGTVSYYYLVKGDLTPRLIDSQVDRLVTLRQQMTRYTNKHKQLARKEYDYVEPVTCSIDDVQHHFRDLDVNDGRRFKAVLEGVNAALHCPDIVPENTILAFGHRWFNVKQFVVVFEYGAKTADALKEDGRKKMFLEGAQGLQHYLSGL